VAVSTSVPLSRIDARREKKISVDMMRMARRIGARLAGMGQSSV
jgi:DNA-binding IclR family transcriptional regulator